MAAVVFGFVVVVTIATVVATMKLVWPAGVAGVVLIALYLWRRRRGVREERLGGLTPAAAWLAYGVWEALLHYRVLCDEECNIRLDLQVILPVLIGLSWIAARTHLTASGRDGDVQATV